jgi:hypothetical protein
MPINCKIIYYESSSATVCTGNMSSLTVDLVQDAIVKHNGFYVDAIDVVYSKDSSNNYPTSSFNLVLMNTTYEIQPIEVEEITGGPFTHVASEFGNYHILTFSPPSGTSDVFTLFNLGTDSGPATKLSVRVKREPGFTCP